MSLYRRLFSILLLAALLPGSARAGTVVHSIVQSYTDKNSWTYLDIQLDTGRMRMDMRDKKGSGYLVYDQLSSNLELVSHPDHKILELTSADLAQLRGDLANFVSGLFNGALTGTPSSEAAQKAMTQVMDQISQPSATGVPYNGYSCSKYEFADKKDGKVFEFWTIPPTATGMTDGEYQTSRGLLDMVLYVIGGALSQFGMDAEVLKRFPYYREYPVMSIFYKKGAPDFVFRVLSIKHQALDPRIFQVPADYQRKDALTEFKASMAQGSKKKKAKEAEETR